VELIKSLLQVGVVAVIGAVISLVTNHHQRQREQVEKEREYKRAQEEKERERTRAQEEKERERIRAQEEKERERAAARWEYREELLKRILDRAMSKYSAVKKARRLLRARGRTGSTPEQLVVASVYYAQIDAINDAQLEFEHLRRDVVTSRQAFSDPDRLIEALETMESYLHSLLDEFKVAFQAFGENATARLSDLPALRMLITEGKTDFYGRFVVGFHTVQETIRADLLHVKLPAFDEESLN
jgi:hypothetical protein